MRVEKNSVRNGSVITKEKETQRPSSSYGYYDDTPGNAEAQRLFVKLETIRNGSEKHCLLVTSAMLGEGKSTISSHIALASSRNRRSPTLYVDFDLRRPKGHKLFNLEKECGVAEVLAGQKSFGECVKDSFVDNLKIMTAGELNFSPLEVFNSETARRFMETARSHFNYIIVDSPPVIPVSDPLTLSRLVDNVVFVVKAGATQRKIVKRALDVMAGSKIAVSGIIVNNMDNVLPCYFDPKYYGYQYYSY